MLEITGKFVDVLLGSMFSRFIDNNIKNYLDRKYVERTISRCADIPAQALDDYFRNESISPSNAQLILDNVQEAIDKADINAKLITNASLDAGKLTDIILTKYTIPEPIINTELQWPFRMALQIAADTLCNIGPRMSEWEREAWRHNFEAFDKLLEKQEAILQSLGPGGQGSEDNRFAHTYRSHILRRLAQIDASTLRVSSSLFLDLSTVFVQPDVVVTPPRSKKKKDKNHTALASLAEARKQIIEQLNTEEKTQRVVAEEFVVNSKRCAIVGLPGSGKTTLLQHILLSVASGNKVPTITTDIVPVLIRIRDLDINNLPGPDELLEVAEGRVFAGACPGYMRRQLESGKVMLLIDGLDEVVTEKRSVLIKWISDLTELYPDTRYVISSRPSGFQSDVFQQLGFRESVLCEFSIDQIREYVRRWMKAVALAEGAHPEDADNISEEYATTLLERAEKNPYVRRIATNPLLLSTLCLVQKYEGGDLPNRRVVLYQRCVEGLLFHWDNKRGLPPAILGSLPLERKLMLLRRLALEMQVRGIAEVEENDVLDSFGKSLLDVGEKTDPSLILNNVRDRSGLLAERRPGVYGFSHLTFQEYLAALSINQTDFPESDRLFLFSKRADTQWSEVIALYAGIAPKAAVENLLNELLESQQGLSTLICAECLAAAQDISISMQYKIIDNILSLPQNFLFHNNLLNSMTVLQSLDTNIVSNRIKHSIQSTLSINVLNYLVTHLDIINVDELLEAGIRILTEKQQCSRYDFGISLLISMMYDSDSVKALLKLVEIARQTNPPDSCLKVLCGIWYLHIAPESHGVLRFLIDETAVEEQLGILNYLTFVTSKQMVQIWFDNKEFYHSRSFIKDSIKLIKSSIVFKTPATQLHAHSALSGLRYVEKYLSNKK